MSVIGARPAPATTLPTTLEELFTETVPAPLLLLVAGPIEATGVATAPTAGAGDLAEACLELVRRGHVPLTTQPPAWSAPSTPDLDAVRASIAWRLVERCDGLVCLGGPSAGEEELVARARARGARVWTSVAEVPRVCARDSEPAGG